MPEYGFRIDMRELPPGIPKELERKLRRASGRTLTKVINRLDKNIKQGMAARKSGRIYKRGKNRKHQASAPGEYPAVDTGRLRNSLGKSEPSSLDDLTAEIFTRISYAALLEEEKNRPFISQGLEQTRPYFAETLEKEVNRVKV